MNYEITSGGSFWIIDEYEFTHIYRRSLFYILAYNGTLTIVEYYWSSIFPRKTILVIIPIGLLHSIITLPANKSLRVPRIALQALPCLKLEPPTPF